MIENKCKFNKAKVFIIIINQKIINNNMTAGTGAFFGHMGVAIALSMASKLIYPTI